MLFFFLITAINSESEIWCKILCNSDTEKTTTWQTQIAFDQSRLSREELSMLVRTALHPVHLPSLPNPDQHPQLLVSQVWAEDCLVEVATHPYVMLKGASRASGKVYNRTFKVTSLNHTSCTNSWVIQSGQVDFHKLSFHIKCNSWFQLHLWKRLKKKVRLHSSQLEPPWRQSPSTHTNYCFNSISLLSPCFPQPLVLYSPHVSSSGHCPPCLYQLRFLFLVPSLGIAATAAPDTSHLLSTPQNCTKKRTHCNTDHFQNLLQAQTIPPRLESLHRTYVSEQK